MKNDRRRRLFGALTIGVTLLLAFSIVSRLAPRMRATAHLPTPPELPADPAALPEWLAAGERRVPDLVPGTEKTIRWHGRPGEPTPLAFVYLHGFSSTHPEIAPVPELLARRFEANLYLARFTGHGSTGAALAAVHIDDWVADTIEALTIARAIGERVVVIATSTGASLALAVADRLAAGSAGTGVPAPPDALILLSPNFGPVNRAAEIARLPWAGPIMRAIAGPERSWEPENSLQARYWTYRYPIEALIPMMAAVELVRDVDTRGLTIPTMVIYAPDDPVVRPAAIERAFRRADPGIVRLVRFRPPSAVARHILAGDILTPAGNEPLVELVAEFVHDLILGNVEVREAPTE